MKTEKMSLKGIKNVLSRGEMKKIMAGSGSCVVGGETCGFTISYSYPPCCLPTRCSQLPGSPYFGTCQ
jgi:hypothetical protein